MPSVSGTYTLEKWERLPRDGNRYELLDGELLVTPSPGPLHQTLVARLTVALAHYVDAHHLGQVWPGLDMFHGPRTVLCPTLPSVSVPPPAASAPGRTPGTGPGDRSAVPIVPALRPRPEARGLPRTRVRVLDRRPGGPVHRALAPGRRGTLHAPRGTPVAPRSVGRAPHARRRQPVRRAGDRGVRTQRGVLAVTSRTPFPSKRGYLRCARTSPNRPEGWTMTDSVAQHAGLPHAVFSPARR